MSCLTLQDLLANWNGLLAVEERQRQAEHLAGCSQCQQLERRLRDVWRLLPLVSRGKPLGATPACLSESELVDYLYGRVGEGNAARVHSHLVNCRHCLEQVAALVAAGNQHLPPLGEEWRAAIEQAEGLVEEPKDSKGWGSAWPVRRWVLATGAAAVLLVASVTWYQLKPGVAPPTQEVRTPAPAPSAGLPAPAPDEVPSLLAENTRSEQVPAIPAPPAVHVRESVAPPVSSLGLVFPQEGQRVLRRELEFRWQAVAGAHTYEVALLDRRGDVLWDAQVKGLSLRIPENVPLRPGERYFVWVVAHREGEGPVRSPSVAFEIEPPDESP